MTGIIKTAALREPTQTYSSSQHRQWTDSVDWYMLIIRKGFNLMTIPSLTKHNSCNLFILQIISSRIERILWDTFAWVSCYVLFWHALHQYNWLKILSFGNVKALIRFCIHKNLFTHPNWNLHWFAKSYTSGCIKLFTNVFTWLCSWICLSYLGKILLEAN